MSDTDLLSQDEIDALLSGVDDGEIVNEDVGGQGETEVEGYDFSSQDRIVRGRMPTLEMINERFTRYFRSSIFTFLRRSSEISVSTLQILKFSEFIHSLYVPSNLNIVRFNPLRGRALFILDSNLVFMLVENFFGGSGKHSAKIEGREFSLTEMGVVETVLELIFKDLKEAWKPVLDVDIDYLNSEMNPRFANIVGPTEVIVVSPVHVEIEGASGNFYIAMPYSMIEPIRDLLSAAVQSDLGEGDDRWEKSLRNDILISDVEVSSELVRKNLTVDELMGLKAGDVIPVEIPETVALEVEGMPIFNCNLGVSDGFYALKIQDIISKQQSDGGSFNRE